MKSYVSQYIALRQQQALRFNSLQLTPTATTTRISFPNYFSLVSFARQFHQFNKKFDLFIL